MDSNISEAVPLRQDLLKSLRRTAWVGWAVAAILFIVVLVLVGVLVLRPTPLMGVDENGNVVGQVVFDEPRLRSSAQILSDMKGLARRCMTVSKISVWDDMEVCCCDCNDILDPEDTDAVSCDVMYTLPWDAPRRIEPPVFSLFSMSPAKISRSAPSLPLPLPLPDRTDNLLSEVSCIDSDADTRASEDDVNRR